MYLFGLCRDRYSMNAMVLLPFFLFFVRRISSSFILSDLIPIALIRDPGFFPHIPIVLFWISAFPVIPLHVSVAWVWGESQHNSYTRDYSIPYLGTSAIFYTGTLAIPDRRP